MKRVLYSTIVVAAAVGLALSSESVAQEKQQAKKEVKTQQVQRGPQFVDKDGDGVCDNLANRKANQPGQGKMAKRGKGYGPGDGTGNQGVGPKDGTGYGPGGSTGKCDGTGPKGTGKGRRG